MNKLEMHQRVRIHLFPVLVLLVFSISTVRSEGELKQTFVTEDFRNVTIVYKMIGCFKDTSRRALPIMLKDLRRLKPENIISTCAKLAWSQGFKGFGVQFYGECWSGNDTVRQYDKYNISTKCDRGIGGHWSNNIYFFTDTKPLALAGPRPWRGTSGTSLQLRCEIKSPFAVKVTWYRNNDEDDSLHTGNIFNFDVVPGDQGYYWCKATTPYGVQVQSQKALVVLEDYYTSIIKFQIKSKSISRSPRSDKYCMPCDQMVKYLTDQTSTKYSRGACRTWIVTNRVQVECTIYRKKSQQDITVYYNNLRTTLIQAARAGRELKRVQWRTLEVVDSEICVEEKTGKESFKGVFTWPSRMPSKSSSVGCPYGPSDVNASRSCNGDFIRGATWSVPDVKNCRFNSKKTNDLNKLSEIRVNAKNVKEVTKNLTKLIKSYRAEALTESDAELTADLVRNIITNKERLNETADLVLDIVDTIMNMNKSTLGASETAASKLTATLDILAENVPMEKGKTSRTFNTSNIVLQVNDISKTFFKGITFGVSKDGLPISTSEPTKTSIKLPSSVLRNTKRDSVRVGFISYANNKFFQPHQMQQSNQSEQSQPSQQVLSSSVFNTNTSNLLEPVVLRFPKPEQEDKEQTLNSSCVFWNEDMSSWSDFGCKVCEKKDLDADDDVVECCCNHLTSFAVLFSPGRPKPSTKAYTKHAMALSIITYVGCAISLVGVVLTFLTYLLFRHLRKTNQQPILMNMCIAIALLLIVFVAGINSTNNILGCQIVAVLLHYLTLVTVLWMGIEAYNLYLQIVKVMAIYQRRFMLKAALVGWGAPLLIVLATVIAAAVDFDQSKSMHKTFKYGSDYACVLTDNMYRIIAWFTPVLGILVFNLIMFILVVYKLNATGAMIQVNSKSQQRRRCWTALAIMCLLGLTWLFGALAISDARIVFEYLFCIFNSLQGFFIFFFHCVRIKEVRSQWTFFVSGLGFSHRESESSHQRSKGFGESHHSSEAFVRVRDWIDKDNDSEVQRKETVLTNISPKRDDLHLVSDSTGNNNW